MYQVRIKKYVLKSEDGKRPALQYDTEAEAKAALKAVAQIFPKGQGYAQPEAINMVAKIPDEIVLQYVIKDNKEEVKA